MPFTTDINNFFITLSANQYEIWNFQVYDISISNILINSVFNPM